MSQAAFVRELRSLMRAPYALLHVETHEEERALELVHQLAQSDGRAVVEWSAVGGFVGTDGIEDMESALQAVGASADPVVVVFKDGAPYLSEPRMRRALREVVERAAKLGQTLIFVGPQRFVAPELEKVLTRLLMPLPNRATVRAACVARFTPAGYPGVDPESLVSGAMGLTLREAERAFDRVRAQYDEALARNAAFDLEQSILREKQRMVSQLDALEFYPLEEGMNEVGGLDELKRWLRERDKAFSDEARAYGLPVPRGLLLVGIQGCGKSLTAKVVGRHWGLPLLRLDLGHVFDGRSAPEETLREALRTCEAIAPCVLWLDEIEKGFAESSTDGTTTRVLGSMLTWLQEKTAPVFLVATANKVEALPPELLRKGRFDEIFFVDLPDAAERADILRIHLARRRRQMPDAVLDDLVKRTEYFSGSELEQVVVSGMYTSFAASRELTADDLVWAVKETVPLYRTYEDQIKALREWATTRARPASLKRKDLDFFNQ
jgi:ATP-dependent 26S proteasome regulatory subunit